VNDDPSWALGAQIKSLASALERTGHPNAHRRVAAGFEDVQVLMTLHRQAGAEAARHPDEQASESEIRRYFELGRAADALHRALIVAAHGAVTVLLHECAGRPSSEMNVAKLLRSPQAAHLTPRSAWQALYCLGVFRNKIIVHHDVPRMLSTMTEADGTRRLVPMPEDFHLDRSDAQRLCEMRDVSGIGTGIDNDFELLEALFYNLPVNFGLAPTRPRQEINQIAERGGVKSQSVAEIVDALVLALDDIAVLADGA
jgi:hypothetical protein